MCFWRRAGIKNRALWVSLIYVSRSDILFPCQNFTTPEKISRNVVVVMTFKWMMTILRYVPKWDSPHFPHSSWGSGLDLFMSKTCSRGLTGASPLKEVRVPFVSSPRGGSYSGAIQLPTSRWQVASGSWTLGAWESHLFSTNKFWTLIRNKSVIISAIGYCA